MRNARGREMACQEQVALGAGTLHVDCGDPAKVIVDNGDLRPYWMCLPCADHNKSNRGAVVYFPKEQSG